MQGEGKFLQLTGLVMELRIEVGKIASKLQCQVLVLLKQLFRIFQVLSQPFSNIDKSWVLLYPSIDYNSFVDDSYF